MEVGALNRAVLIPSLSIAGAPNHPVLITLSQMILDIMILKVHQKMKMWYPINRLTLTLKTKSINKTIDFGKPYLEEY